MHIFTNSTSTSHWLNEKKKDGIFIPQEWALPTPLVLPGGFSLIKQSLEILFIIFKQLAIV
jgi:hypothetical protein